MEMCLGSVDVATLGPSQAEGTLIFGSLTQHYIIFKMHVPSTLYCVCVSVCMYTHIILL